MAENIILIGFMGTGKDEVGKQIANKTTLNYISIDKYIELKENMSITKIFDEYGEQYFRELEKKALVSLKNLKNVVISTGGGIVLAPQNRRLLSQIGRVVHLHAELDVIEQRLKEDTLRPLIKDKQKIKQLYVQRYGIYEFADYKIDTSHKSTSEVADEIIKKYGIRDKLPRVPTREIAVNTEGKKYSVYTGCKLFHRLGRLLKKLNIQVDRAVVITNPIVGSLYLTLLLEELKKYGINPLYFIVPDGEEYKTIDTASQIYNFLLHQKIERVTPIISLGGGVIGDLSGFIASTYKRGTPFIQLPTTLISQIDAAIGGKTGVNHPLGKNMIGTFYQPDIVIVDVNTLLSLPAKEFNNGIAELIKYSIIKDAALFSLLESKQNEILNRDIRILSEIIARCVQIKKEIVEIDEKETKGIRELLNYGHTFGHIIESLTKYTEYSHGEAISIGMIEEAKYAVKLGFLKEQDLNRIIQLIRSYGLPYTPPDEFTSVDLKTVIFQDKKMKYGKINLPIPRKIGTASVRKVTCQSLF